jgi:hypothetical protein
MSSMGNGAPNSLIIIVIDIQRKGISSSNGAPNIIVGVHPE